MKRTLPFAIAGVAGYLVDAGVLSLVFGLLGPVWGRVLSWSCAVTATWLINRNFAFSDRAARQGKRRELGRYGLAMIPGAMVNWLAYGGAMAVLPALDWRPALAVAAGSLAGLGVNLVAAHKLVFRGDR
ncbi:hypothetical protein VW29_04650 [Devosia limi DSM 17137]|uniref:Putative flippase GtrA (Transmembrane translocase of bactoprenol-linked glucose) n=1 Tax=Devosia limi DSM 17137 TaxID=1121477 RepID=A0A0F5LWN4_9HYPH|nr:GtrA family protein [Devosia limi]KKB86047.1 hypothetical protein VW29_04650 [Devosia limi DSM 17137]SHG00711.1 Putative flippase GtrA (transmembrane translocase of bactoprenol-linked glucose) [Devosia limi DSM 17137]